MATSNQIDVVIPQSVIDLVTTNLQAARTALAPYLFALTNEQRESIPKMGDKTLAFVGKNLIYSGTNPEFAPGYFVRVQLEHDYNVTQSLSPINGLLLQLSSDITDTMMIAGSEAYLQSLVYYAAVKGAADTGQAAAKPIYDDLKERFPGRSSKKQAEK